MSGGDRQTDRQREKEEEDRPTDRRTDLGTNRRAAASGNFAKFRLALPAAAAAAAALFVRPPVVSVPRHNQPLIIAALCRNSEYPNRQHNPNALQNVTFLDILD